MDSKVSQLHDRAKSLIAQGGADASYIEKAIALDREALKLSPPGSPDSERAASLSFLANHLSDRYNQLGEMRDLEEAIVLSREALGIRPRGHLDRSESLNNLAVYLAARYEQLGETQDLSEVIALDREALNLHQEGHPDRSTSLNNLAVHLSTRFQQLGDMQDLNEAIVLGREALSRCPEGQPDRPISLNNLVLHLSILYKQLGEFQVLDEAITLGRQALGLCPQGHPDRSMSLNNLAVDLCTRYEQLGEMQDLNEAIVLEREALVLFPRGQPHRPTSLNNLSVHLSTRYERLGEIQDLNEAIILDREALDLHPQGHADRSISLSNLAVDLSARYKQLGVMQDLDEAIVLNRQALDLRPQGHPQRSIPFNNLAADLSARFNRFGDMQDLDEAIVLSREALDLRPPGHPDRSMTLSNLAVHLCTRYERLAMMQDLNEAIVLDREAFNLRPPGHPDRSMSLNNLAADLSIRYEKLGEIQDLDGAIVLGREALDFRPQGHPDRSQSLDRLAGYLCNRFTRLEKPSDKDEMFSLYAQLVRAPQVVISGDLAATRRWISVAEEFRHPTLLLAYETSLRFLVQHLSTLPSLPQHLGILKNLTSSLAVDAFSACLRNRSPSKAVELLEQGRGVFWSQLTRLRSPLEDVIESGPEGNVLAEEFVRLASLIRDAVNSPSADQHEHVYRLNLEMLNVVMKIRERPGLSRFLLPPPFSDLRCIAKGGPVVVVNSSTYSCDALVILLDRDPVHIPLQITREGVRDLATELLVLTKRAARGNVTRELAVFLRNLWDRVVSRVVDFLQTILPFQSRIWWCPTAEFSQLPLHAAGPFRKGHRNLPDLYVSSYTPTLTALIRARDSSDPLSVRKRLVAVGQGKAAGESELPSVSAELDNIGKCVDGLATFTCIQGKESCVARMSKEISQNEWVHLACHGLPNRTQPFESAFALHDGHFTIQRLIGCNLKNPEFAYLSACHTTVGDKDSPDEVIHLASAMQFAGFRSVIGTMWAVDDGETTKITPTFYKYMVDEFGRLDHTRAAFALNKTMRLVNIPLDQRILYIHLGA